MPFETPDLVPPSFEPPRQLNGGEFVFRPLTIDDARRDFAAVDASRERLRGVFGPSSEGPSPELTLAQNRIDVAWHHKEFQRRDAFTYAVVDPDDTVELGCLYVQPTARSAYDAAIYFWIAETGHDSGLAETIETHLREWINQEWPFEAVAYPGRDIPWTDWENTD